MPRPSPATPDVGSEAAIDIVERLARVEAQTAMLQAHRAHQDALERDVIADISALREAAARRRARSARARHATASTGC